MNPQLKSLFHKTDLIHLNLELFINNIVNIKNFRCLRFIMIFNDSIMCMYFYMSVDMCTYVYIDLTFLKYVFLS